MKLLSPLNGILIPKLGKTIADSSKNLSELGISQIVLAKLLLLIPMTDVSKFVVQWGSEDLADGQFADILGIAGIHIITYL